MFHDLLNMDLGDWHPREIPASLLAGAALQKQQSHSLPPMEQWYVMLLHEGILPGAVVAANKVTTAWTKALMENAITRVPRLRYELTEVGLREFLLDEARIGAACSKYRQSKANGWTFPPLAEARSAWIRLYGPTVWDNPEVEEWTKRAC
jgi:hypothetical protein